MPPLDPIPSLPSELRFVVPDEAQDASYFAASARMDSLSIRVRAGILVSFLESGT
jgi:hypothetical protein